MLGSENAFNSLGLPGTLLFVIRIGCYGKLLVEGRKGFHDFVLFCFSIYLSLCTLLLLQFSCPDSMVYLLLSAFSL